MNRVDVTQFIAPSTASPNAAVNAASLKGSVATQVVGLAETAYNMKKQYDIQSTLEEARAARDEFLDRNMAKEAADEQKIRLSQAIKQEVSIFEAGMETGEQEDAQRQKIRELTTELNRLRDSKDLGGMSNQSYYEKVRTITKKSIANYPGLADEIRKAVGSVTGLPYADEDAAMRFVRTRFKESDGPTEAQKQQEWAKKQDIERAVKMTGRYSYEDLLKMHDEDPIQYGHIIDLANTAQRSLSQAELLKAEAESRAFNNKQRVRDVVAVYNAAGSSLAEYRIANVTSKRIPQIKNWEARYKAVQGGNLGGVPDLDTEVKLHMSELTFEAKQAFAETRVELIRKMDADRVEPEIKKSALEEFDSNAKASLEALNPDDAAKRSLFMQIYMADRTRKLEENLRLMDVASKLMANYNSPEAIRYLVGSPAHKDSVRKQSPNLAKYLDIGESLLLQGGSGVITALKGDYDKVASEESRLETTPGATQPIGASTEVEQARVDITTRSAFNDVVQKLKLSNKNDEEAMFAGKSSIVNKMTALIGNIMVYGRGTNEFSKVSEFIMKEMETMPPSERAVFQTSIQKDYEASINTLRRAWEESGKPTLTISKSGDITGTGSPTGEMGAIGVYGRLPDFYGKWKHVIDGLIVASEKLTNSSRERATRMLITSLQGGSTWPLFEKESTPVSKETKTETKNYKTEKSLPDAMKQGIEDLKTELESKKALLADIREGTPTYERTSQDIKDIEEELKRYTKGK